MMKEDTDKFKFWATTQLPELLSTHECLKEETRQTDRMILEYMPSADLRLEDVKARLTGDLEMKPIYAGYEPSIVDGGKSYCACSRSGSGMMVKIFVKTSIRDRVMSALVTIYESLDIMVHDIADDLQRHINQGRCTVETPLNLLYAEFLK